MRFSQSPEETLGISDGRSNNHPLCPKGILGSVTKHADQEFQTYVWKQILVRLGNHLTPGVPPDFVSPLITINSY